jgi:hypothetical protein
VAVAASTSEADPVACAARSLSRAATAPAAAEKRAASAGRADSSSAGVTASSTRGREPGLMTGAYCTPATAGTPCRTVPAGYSVGACDVVEGDVLM